MTPSSTRARPGAPKPKAKAADSVRFKARLAPKGPRGPWLHLFLPARASRFLGVRGLAAIFLTVGDKRFRCTALPDGKGGHFIQLNGAMRIATETRAGDELEFEVALDRASREVRVPADVASALTASPAARAAFESMPPSHRKAYLAYIGEAKKPATRVQRISQSLERLAQWSAQRAAAKKVKGA